MLKKLFFSLGILLSVNLMVFSQSGELKGKITDKDTKEPIAFANIIIEQSGKQFGGGTTDFDGNYTIKPIPAGRYDVKATYIGYKPLLIKGVVINADKMTFNNVFMESSATTLEVFTVVDYKVPLIQKDQTSSGATLTSEDISRMPGRSAESVAATMGGVQSTDGGGMGSVRGARSDDGSTVTYVDGVRVRGTVNLPKSAMGEVSMILGGIPARYGEATGGVMNIVTTGPSREFGGGVEFVTSQFLDKFGRNLASFNLTGPLLKSKDDNKSSLLGFFLAGEFAYSKDTRPFANGDYRVNDEKRIYLEQNPLRIENGVVRRNADFLRKSDLEIIDAKENGARYSANFSGKIDVRTTKNTNLQFGGNFSYDKGRRWDRANSLLNSANNGEFILSNWSVNGKFTQRFPADKESKSLIKNVYYQIQADYSKTNQTLQDKNHKDNLFNYGYVGKFTTTMLPTFVTGTDTVDGLIYENALLMANVSPFDVAYERSEINPLLANYTSQLYNSFSGGIRNQLLIQSLGGLRNGDVPTTVYQLYNRTGAVYNAYNLYDNSQIGITVNGSADIGNHAFEFGIQYEQIAERNIAYSPARLWELARTLTNSHIDQINTNDPYLSLGGLQDTIYYNYIYNQSKQSTFDINLRQKLGMPVNGHTIHDWIDVDKYDPSTYSIDMFSPDELFENGNNQENPLLRYYGYDYTGKKLNSKPSLNDFFTAKDENGRYKREIAAFEPLYMAGYIQDKFAFNDLIFNVGVRIDRFDANQMVLKDPYLFYDTKRVTDVDGSLNAVNGGNHPSNIGQDFVVYVDDYKATSPKILGYRSGDVWYNSTGTVVSDPTQISGTSGKPTPYRVDPNQSTLSIDAFEDYKPQTTFMPRIAFSFPISDEALFFAHYDVITKRPTDGLRLDPISYLFIDNAGTRAINNPNLLPEQTTDYELGFQQKISNSSSLKFSAFYREMRNQVQVKRFTGADPNPNYLSYTNIDFGTVKGLTVSYDLRRTGNIRVTANYTLQFANGTGSNSESQKAMVSSGQPNLRTMTPLTYDQRHAVKASFDYRYGAGKKYDGPKHSFKIKGTDKVKTILFLENTGLNVTFNGSSGTPYTKRDFNENTIVGQLNGSRLPWQFWIDAQVNKAFMLKVGTRMLDMNIYLAVLNVLNSENVQAVYGTTGNPNDDGYLTNPKYQAQINAYEDPQSYRDLRSVSTNSPYNYSLPRRIRLGLEINF